MHYAYYLLTAHFLLVWTFFLALVVVGGVYLSGLCTPLVPSISERDARKPGAGWFSQLSLTDGIAGIALLVFVTFYIVAIFYKEDFAYYDDDMLTDYSLQGRSFLPPVWPGTGRFYPLADQEFNLLRFFTRSPAGYHALVAVELVVLLVVLFFVLREFKLRYSALIIMAALLAPSFLVPFTGFVYPERNVLFWLTIILLCLQGYSKTKSRICFVGCLVATHFALYYKETVVLLVVGYALTRLFLQLYPEWRSGSRSWKELAKENSLPLGMLAVSSIYLVLFLGAMLPHRKFSYVTEHHSALSSVIFAYVQIDWLPLILLMVLVVRIARFLFSRNKLDPMWDSLAVGALAYFFGVLAVRLNSAYYMAPVDFIALLYLASMALKWLSKPTQLRVAVVAIVFICVLFHDAAYSSFRIVERKDVITDKSQLADFLKGYLPTTKGNTVELYFPYTDGYRLMGLSSYLKYKGFQLVGQDTTGQGIGPRIAIEGAEKFADNRCVQYKDYVCVHEDSAGPGALIVVLPDDDASMSDVENLDRSSKVLLSVKAPGLLTRKGSWFRSLYAISPLFSLTGLPEHWLELDVFQRPA